MLLCQAAQSHRFIRMYETSGWQLRYVMWSHDVHQLILQLIYDVYFLHEAEDAQ